MKKLILTAVGFLIVGLAAITGGAIVESNAIWHWSEILLVFGGIMVGGAAALLTLVRLSEENPSILTEIEKLDRPR